MINLVVDTHQLVNHLESFGFTKKQAEGVTEALNKLDISQLATKQDVQDLKQDLKQEIKEVRHEIKEARTEAKNDLLELKADLFKWFLPALLGQTAIFGAIVKFIH